MTAAATASKTDTTKATGRKAGTKVTTTDNTVTTTSTSTEFTKVRYFLTYAGQTEVHAMTCSTGRTRAKNPQVSQYDPSHPATDEVSSRVVFIRRFWADQIAESEEDVTEDAALMTSSYAGATEFHKCLDFLPDGITTAKVKAQAVKREAKQALATFLVTAMAAAVELMLGGDAVAAEQNAVVLKGMTEDEIRKAAAHWVHHLPVNRDAWPATLPKPDRSDWR